jgi:hypothetical protein
MPGGGLDEGIPYILQKSLIYLKGKGFMNDPQSFGFNDSGRRAPKPNESPGRAVGSPLPVGKGGRIPFLPEEDDSQSFNAVPPPGRTLANSSPDPLGQQPSGVDRAMGLLRMALPLVQKLLPLLDGNVVSAVTNVLTPHQHPQPAPVHPPVNLEPIETSLAELQSRHQDLHDRVVEQNSSLKRVEDQLDMVREATDRNTLEQQELLEDLKTVGNKINVFAVVALALLAGSILLNVILYLHIQRVLP